MVLRLLLYVIAILVATGTAGLVAYRAGKYLLRGPLETRRRRLRGIANARLLDKHLDEEICFICLNPTVPETDAYDRKRGWYHATCFNRLLNG